MRIGPYVLLGLLIVALVDFAAPDQVYVETPSLLYAGKALSLPYFASLLVAGFITFIELIKDGRLACIPKKLTAFLLVAQLAGTDPPFI